MQVQLKQVEIEQALKQFVAQQGFALAGKQVEISFTAGRKDGGLTADISIEDVSIPGTDLMTESGAAPKPVLVAVKAAEAEPAGSAGEQPAAEAPAKSLFG